jgi:hypothetical protein
MFCLPTTQTLNATPNLRDWPPPPYSNKNSGRFPPRTTALPTRRRRLCSSLEQPGGYQQQYQYRGPIGPFLPGRILLVEPSMEVVNAQSHAVDVYANAARPLRKRSFHQQWYRAVSSSFDRSIKDHNKASAEASNQQQPPMDDGVSRCLGRC